MQKVIKSAWLGPLISGILTFIAEGKINFLASFICFIPLFISISNSAAKEVFKKGLLFGFVLSIAAFFWMIPGAERFTGNSIIYGIAVFLISAFFISAFYSGLMYSFARLSKKEHGLLSVLLNGILIASIFCVGESLLSIVSAKLPWFDIHAGSGLAENFYAIQPAALFGIHILTFTVVFVNYLFAFCIANNAWKNLYVPAVAIAVYFIIAVLLLKNFENTTNSVRPFKVAILAENVAPEMKWDVNTGNLLVEKLLGLTRTAAALKPDVALWSESAVPWTYRKNDDFVKEILSITAPSNVTHLLGINTDYKQNVVFNSAYCILPDGQVSNRYDKQYLLSFIEQPVGGVLMPFYSSGGFSAASNKSYSAPLNTPYGKAGVFICNEAAIPAAAANMVKQGAQFLFNISNDGWFNDTYIVRLHYYYARLRAVESRKDLAINSNNGYSGMVKASGEIIEQERSEDPFVKLVTMQPNNTVSMASLQPNLLAYICALFVLVSVIQNLLMQKKRE